MYTKWNYVPTTDNCIKPRADWLFWKGCSALVNVDVSFLYLVLIFSFEYFWITRGHIPQRVCYSPPKHKSMLVSLHSANINLKSKECYPSQGWQTYGTRVRNGTRKDFFVMWYSLLCEVSFSMLEEHVCVCVCVYDTHMWLRWNCTIALVPNNTTSDTF
jgi:hypothetical protein